MNAPAIEVRGLTRRFADVTAVDDLTLTVSGPGVFGFLGANGAGKTTAIRMMVGLIHPTAGEIRLLGRPASSRDASVRGQIGYLPQEPAFYSWMKGEEALLHVGDLFGLTRRESRRRAAELLEICGLEEAGHRKVGGYSGGMKQRLGIAQALMNRPKLLLLDEPVSALDPVGRAEVLELMSEIGKESTLFMSSHILADVERVCEEVAIIDQGRLLVQERTAELTARAVRPILVCEVRGDVKRLRARLEQEPWLIEVDVETESTAVACERGGHRVAASGEDEAASSPPESPGNGEHTPVGGSTRLRLTTSDLDAAERCLPKLLAEADMGLVSLSPAMPSLEEVFIALIGRRSSESGEARS